ncbi:MAG TPA: response regulator transcription factor [Prolixibacteraceae bacterium]|nr:response regulator transcription factor [Prolixibacteraceae bacterium]HPT31425.1 response regulator transcription factor [Prolixibacteraceae bacterium]
MKEKQLKILMAEDDLNLGFLLTEFLDGQGLHVKLFRDGESALSAFRNGNFNFCILDVMLPGIDGFNLAREIKKIRKEVPVIFLTARSMKQDKLKGYDLGADDYITKPFDEDELLCRIKAVVNRMEISHPDSREEPVMIGKYQFDMANLALINADKTRRLTIREAEVLRLLCSSRNNVVKREQILTTIWGENDYFAGRSLDVFITKLRKYFAEDPSVKIENIPKVGFLLSCNSEN